MKRFIFAVFLSLSFNLFAATGVLSGEKDLRVSKTQWFDIIYPQRCEKSAAILYENADKIYFEVTEQYGLEPVSRIPVVLTPAVDRLNAFWAVVPYGHIVLYDTSFDSINELAVFSENLLSIFRHELTHGVTFTMKNGFWSTITKIFGDPMNIGPLLVTSGMAEGATLTSESARGEGRLNDEYAKHSVKQAKIENKFPKYYGVQGAGSLNPYYFNGAFHEWLQNEYGMEAYAKFWYYTINFQGLTTRKRFKKAFGEKLDIAWKNFIEDYEVPDVPENPVLTHQVKDFFVPYSNNYSMQNNAGSLFTSLTASQNKIFWLDSADYGIFVAEKKDAGGEKLKYKKLLTQNGVYNLGVSEDSKFLAISFYSDNTQTISAKIKIYNTETKQCYTLKETGLKDGTIIQKDGEYYLVASKFVPPYNSIQIYKINLNAVGKITNLEKYAEKILPVNCFTASYSPIFNSEEGYFAFVNKQGMNYSVCIADLFGNTIEEFFVPRERMVINSLSSANEALYFSWVTPGKLPAVGKLDLRSGDFALSSQEISGGVFSPVASGESVIYSGHYLYQNRLLILEPELDLVKADTKSIESTKENDSIYDLQIPQWEPFKAINYLKKGFFIPLSVYETERFGINLNKEAASDFSLGATYLTALPWTDGTSDSVLLSVGLNLLSQTAGLQLTTTFGSDTSVIKNNFTLKTEFDQKGWKQSSTEIVTSSAFHFGKTSIFQIINNIEAGIGRQYIWIPQENEILGGRYNRDDDSIYCNFTTDLSLAYSNAHYSGPGLYERTGFTTTIDAYYIYDGNLENSIKTLNSFDLSLSGAYFIPKLLPFDSPYSFITNLPVVLNLNILSLKARSISILDFSAESVLFGMLIDRPMPLLDGIYLQNWKIIMGYAGSFYPCKGNVYSGFQFGHLFDYLNQLANGDFIYRDSIILQADLKISPNMGIFARNDFQADIYAKAMYKFHKQITENSFAFDFGVNVKM